MNQRIQKSAMKSTHPQPGKAVPVDDADDLEIWNSKPYWFCSSLLSNRTRINLIDFSARLFHVLSLFIAAPRRRAPPPPPLESESYSKEEPSENNRYDGNEDCVSYMCTTQTSTDQLIFFSQWRWRWRSKIERSH